MRDVDGAWIAADRDGAIAGACVALDDRGRAQPVNALEAMVLRDAGETVYRLHFDACPKRYVPTLTNQADQPL